MNRYRYRSDLDWEIGFGFRFSLGAAGSGGRNGQEPEGADRCPHNQREVKGEDRGPKGLGQCRIININGMWGIALGRRALFRASRSWPTGIQV